MISNNSSVVWDSVSASKSVELGKKQAGWLKSNNRPRRWVTPRVDILALQRAIQDGPLKWLVESEKRACLNLEYEVTYKSQSIYSPTFDL